jgi:peroxiredoxin (alkyl hydroperoxide reductase subunit C)
VALAPGTPAPDFSLATGEQGRVTRDDLKGRTVVLVFYPFAFSPVCTDQLNLYEEVLGELRAQGAEIYGVSCDSPWSQKAFAEQLGVTIPQLSDWEPKGEVCRAFDVYHPGGFPQRALVILDPEGTVAWSYQAASPSELPGVNLIFDALEQLAAARS